MGASKFQVPLPDTGSAAGRGMEIMTSSWGCIRIHPIATSALLVLFLIISADSWVYGAKTASGKSTMADVIIEKDTACREYQVEPEQDIVIRLPENPSTGYRWEKVSIDTKILTPLRSDFSAADTSVLGAGGRRIYVFRARSPGITTLRFVLKRSWESGDKAVDHFEFLIHVRDISGEVHP